tara:strand:+ start:21431 stop:21673 length:243 start_codon:yes stop_codon:yes gene_type:complete
MKKQIDNKNLYVDYNNNAEIYYSYNTIVAFKTPSEICVSENVWSKTTACHLNRIEELNRGSKKDRIPYPDFARKLKELTL